MCKCSSGSIRLFPVCLYWILPDTNPPRNLASYIYIRHVLKLTYICTVSRLGHIHFIQPCLCTPFLQTWNASSRDLCYDMYRSNCKQTFYPLNTNKHFSHLTPICVKERTGHHTSFVMHFKPYICVNFTLLTKGMKSIPPIGVLSVTRYVTPFLV